MLGQMPEPMGHEYHGFAFAHSQKVLKELELTFGIEGRARFIDSDEVNFSGLEAHKRTGSEQSSA